MQLKSFYEIGVEMDEIRKQYTAEEQKRITVFVDSASRLLLIDSTGKNIIIELEKGEK